MKIAKVESFHIVADRAAHAAGGTVARRRTSATPGVKALDYNAGRHLCAYPAMDETLLVRLTSDTGLVGWGEAHSPPVPGVAKAVIADLLRAAPAGAKSAGHRGTLGPSLRLDAAARARLRVHARSTRRD